MGSWTAYLENVLEQFGYDIPIILICVGGIVVAFTKTRRAKKPAVLVIVALVIILMSTVLYSLAIAYLITNQPIGFAGLSLTTLMYLSGIAMTASLAVGIGILIHATFVDRRQALRSDD